MQCIFLRRISRSSVRRSGGTSCQGAGQGCCSLCAFRLASSGIMFSIILYDTPKRSMIGSVMINEVYAMGVMVWERTRE
jgi:hypothetical protein